MHIRMRLAQTRLLAQTLTHTRVAGLETVLSVRTPGLCHHVAHLRTECQRAFASWYCNQSPAPVIDTADPREWSAE